MNGTVCDGLLRPSDLSIGSPESRAAARAMAERTINWLIQIVIVCIGHQGSEVLPPPTRTVTNDSALRFPTLQPTKTIVLRESLGRLRDELCPVLTSSFRDLGSGRGCCRTLPDGTWVATYRLAQSLCNFSHSTCIDAFGRVVKTICPEARSSRTARYSLRSASRFVYVQYIIPDLTLGQKVMHPNSSHRM